jgi:hypothetical protein
LTEHTPGWTAPQLGGVNGLAQVHCHQHAVLGWEADRKLLEEAGATIERLDSGCCGLAGNFGFEAGHLEISRACAEQVLLPTLRQSGPDDVVLADGFSCRTQIHELDSGGKEAIHLAELLARAERPRAGASEDGHQTAGWFSAAPLVLGLASAASSLVGARWLARYLRSRHQ